jgi:hypothetical protein
MPQAPKPSWRRRPAMLAVLALAVAISLASAVVARSPATHPNGRSEAVAPITPLQQPAGLRHKLHPSSAAAEKALQSLVERHLLNALLVPALDDEADPPRFADPWMLMDCGSRSRAEVDGQPLQPGAVQGRRFRLRWTLDHCLPFGQDGPMFEGVAELDVTRATPGLRAQVRLEALNVVRAGATLALTGLWTASTP